VIDLSDALTCKFERPAFEAALALLREAQEP
jgi:hypothetical protein